LRAKFPLNINPNPQPSWQPSEAKKIKNIFENKKSRPFSEQPLSLWVYNYI